MCRASSYARNNFAAVWFRATGASSLALIAAVMPVAPGQAAAAQPHTCVYYAVFVVCPGTKGKDECEDLVAHGMGTARDGKDACPEAVRQCPLEVEKLRTWAKSTGRAGFLKKDCAFAMSLG